MLTNIKKAAHALLRLPKRYDKSLEKLATARTIEMLERQRAQEVQSTPEWAEFEARFLTAIENFPLQTFCRWPITRETMFVGNARYLLAELRYLRATSRAKLGKKSLQALGIGGAERCIFWPNSDGNTIHHHYQLAKFEDQTGYQLSDLDVIIEFGGGFGSMCNLAFRKGFHGQYVIVDLPALHLLQMYALTTAGFSVESAYLDDPADTVHNVHLSSSFKDAEREFAAAGKRTAFVASWSLSEAPLAVRQEIRSSVSNFDAVFVAFQRQFSGLDNFKYFSEWTEDLGPFRWSLEHLEHLPDNYLMCGIR